MSRVLPTTRAGAEIAILIAFVGWRAAVLAQMLPALPAGTEVARLPAIYVLVAAVVLLETIASCAAGIGARRSIGAVWTWCEILGGCAVLLLTPRLVPTEHLIGSWVGFAPGLMLAIVGLAGAGLTRSAPHRWLQLSAAIVLSTGCYLLATLPSAPTRLIPTVAGNALTYPTFAVLVGVVTAYVRRLAADADRARQRAAESAELAERRRNQLLLHDSAGILQMVAAEDTVPDLATALRRQAATESARIRAFLTSPQAAPAGDPVTITGAVGQVVEGFPDLPIDLVLDLGGSTPLDTASAHAVQGALRALLHNVRRHADARSVVIHADAAPGGGQWELSVRDDGRGYDMATTPLGFGLNVQVHHVLADHGIVTEIHSEPGEGTVAVLRGIAKAARRPSQ